MSYSTLLGRLAIGALLLSSTNAATSPWANRTLNIGYVIFPGYEPLDVYGPLEILFQLSDRYNISLSTVAPTLGPQSARPPLSNRMIGPATVATHTFEDAPTFDVIIVPGGGGLDTFDRENNTQIEDFLVSRYESTPYILSVCNGAVTLAKSGLLSGKRATTSKAAYKWVTDPKHGDDIQWMPSARWVNDGKIWTSSGVSAGMDMMYAFLKHIYGDEEWVDFVMNLIEYVPHTDPHWDPFSVVWKVPGADNSRPLEDCAAPVGYESESEVNAQYVQSIDTTASLHVIGDLL